MKLAVLGSTGATGKVFTALALAEGHLVTALVRNAAKVTIDHPNLHIVEGDATDMQAVTTVINNVDAVVSCLGHVKGGACPMLSIAFDNIVSAASKQAQPPRCVMMTTMGVGGTSLVIKFVLSMLVGWRVIGDYEKADALVRRSNVPYVVVRPGHLVDAPSMDKYTVSFRGFYHIAMKISRADVAKFLMTAASSTEYEKRAVQLYA